MENNYDVVVIGSGPGGYISAIRASQLGKKVALVEKYEGLGGTCTNVGCIPAKALLDSSEHYHQAVSEFKVHGIETDNLQLNFTQFMARKNEVIKQNNSGLTYLMRKNKINVYQGIGSFADAQHLRVTTVSGEQTILTATNFIIATGSKPSSLPGVTIDKKRIITSTEAMALKEKPKSMIVIGGGVIGIELASLFSRLGTNITIIEYADAILPTMDRELGKTLQKSLSKLDIQFNLNQRVQEVRNLGDLVSVTYLDSENQEHTDTAEYCLIAVGRKPYTEGLNLEQLGIQTDKGGRIIVNDKLQTPVAHIYAIGDVIAGPMLAHKAEEDGKYAAELICDKEVHLDYNLIPGVVYTWPEVAAVGKTEEQLKSEGIAYGAGKFPFMASGRARASRDPDGFAKVLVDKVYGEILGVHIIGARAADLIPQAVLGIKNELTAKEMHEMVYPHPTFSEVLKEAYLMAAGEPAVNL
jgi:dihydrolipoamide dehydrogenase